MPELVLARGQNTATRGRVPLLTSASRSSLSLDKQNPTTQSTETKHEPAFFVEAVNRSDFADSEPAENDDTLATACE